MLLEENMTNGQNEHYNGVQRTKDDQEEDPQRLEADGGFQLAVQSARSVETEELVK